MISLMIAVALTLVCDRAFNHGNLTIRLFDSAASARDWAMRSGNDVATAVTGFRGS